MKTKPSLTEELVGVFFRHFACSKKAGTLGAFRRSVYMRHLAVMGGLLLAGCAAHPPAATQDGSAGVPHLASAAASPPNSVQVQQDAAVRQAVKTGYRTKSADGGKLYCREQTHIGSHFSDTACFTPEQLVRMMAVQSELQDMLNVPERCTGGFSCNGIGGGGKQ